MQLLTQIRSRELLPDETSILIYTQFGDISKCVECIKEGATDFILKRDPETHKDNLDALVERCRELLFASASRPAIERESLGFRCDPKNKKG